MSSEEAVNNVKELRNLGYQDVQIVKMEDLDGLRTGHYCAMDIWEMLMPHYRKQEPTISFLAWVRKEYPMFAKQEVPRESE